MDLFKEFAVDETKITKGVWHVIEPSRTYPVEEGEIGEQAAVLIASTDNPEYRALVEKKLKPHVMRYGQNLDTKVRERCTAEALAEKVILDWRNFMIAGESIPYSRAKVIEFLLETKWVRLRQSIMAAIGDDDVFMVSQAESIIKNS